MIDSVVETFKERTRNPFFATLIGVWLVRNWELVYTLFNFDEPCTLGEKKQFVLTYYHDKVWYNELIVNISVAFGLMLLAYVLFIISKLILNVTYHNIIPRMNEKTVSSLVVNRDVHNSVKNERNSFYNQLEDEREKTIKLEEKFAKLKFEKAKSDEELLEFRIKNDSLIAEADKMTSENKSLTDKLEQSNFRIEESETVQVNMTKQIEVLSERISDLTSNSNNAIGLNERLKLENNSLRNQLKNYENSIIQRSDGMGLLNRKDKKDSTTTEISSFNYIFQTLSDSDKSKFRKLLSNNPDSSFEISNVEKDFADRLKGLGLIYEIFIPTGKIAYTATQIGVQFYNYLYDKSRGYNID